MQICINCVFTPLLSSFPRNLLAYPSPFEALLSHCHQCPILQKRKHWPQTHWDSSHCLFAPSFVYFHFLTPLDPQTLSLRCLRVTKVPFQSLNKNK
ncbi:hypothetical protein GDO86_007295 [Hymenochirus boettgeri]|uniref:Uncharacterized protein n=1 Tax=Hymenochirus boettgeri TaxID=247094 RepID=A0A8T2J0C4_9PIPI|nr:hypothetical protein GDO86_007295 [Hymenochirus boettgeri]